MTYFDAKIRLFVLKRFLIENKIYNFFINTLCIKNTYLYQVLMYTDYFAIFRLKEFTENSNNPKFWEKIHKKWLDYYDDYHHQIEIITLSNFIINHNLYKEIMLEFHNSLHGLFKLLFTTNKNRSKRVKKLITDLIKDGYTAKMILDSISNHNDYYEIYTDEFDKRKQSYIINTYIKINKYS